MPKIKAGSNTPPIRRAAAQRPETPPTNSASSRLDGYFNQPNSRELGIFREPTEEISDPSDQLTNVHFRTWENPNDPNNPLLYRVWDYRGDKYRQQVPYIARYPLGVNPESSSIYTHEN